MSQVSTLSQNRSATIEDVFPKLAEVIFKSIREVKFGSVEIVIHESKVVQVEKKEKIRF